MKSKRRMKTKGLNAIITSVLIILFSIVAIAIIAVVVRNSTTDSLNKQGVGVYTAQFEIPYSSVYVNHTSKEVFFTIKRKAGAGEVRGFLVSLYDHLGNNQLNRSYENTRLGELETLRVHFIHSLPGNVTKLSVSAVVNSTGGAGIVGDPFTELSIGAGGGVGSSSGPGGSGGPGGGSNSSNGTQCSDGFDNDYDDMIDYPTDPGCSSASDNSESGEEVDFSPAYAYSWERSTSHFETMVPFYWYMEGGFNCIGDSLAHGQCEITSGYIDTRNFSLIKDYMLTLPSGHRVLFFWNSEYVLGDLAYDNITDPVSHAVYSSPWKTNGMLELQRRVRYLLDNYTAQSGEPDIDMFVFDYEGGFLSNWGLNENISRALANDPRFYSEIVPYLGYSNLTPIYSWPLNYSYTVPFNLLMTKIATRYFNNATVNVIKQYYPNAKVVNFAEQYYNYSYPIRDLNGHLTMLAGDNNASYISGEYQSTDVYGRMCQISVSPGRAGIPGYLYTQTEFNTLKYAQNNMRTSVLLDNKPVFPWIAFRTFAGDDGDHDGVVEPGTTSDWYVAINSSNMFQEDVIHSLVAGAPDLLSWNAYQYSTPSLSDWYVNKTIKEFNKIAAYSGRRSLVRNVTGWTANYTFTGTLSNGRKVWRFTPNLDQYSGAQKISGFALNQTIQSVNSSGIIFRVSGATITFPQGVFWNPSSPASRSGAWVIQPSSALDPYVS